MLTLPIKRKWFDMIASGVKREEYREIKPYYDARFKQINVPVLLRLRAGYAKDAPLMQCSVTIHKGNGRAEWGAVPGIQYYVLAINSIEIINTA